jgi:hypothetical protein
MAMLRILDFPVQPLHCHHVVLLLMPPAHVQQLHQQTLHSWPQAAIVTSWVSLSGGLRNRDKWFLRMLGLRIRVWELGVVTCEPALRDRGAEAGC